MKVIELVVIGIPNWWERCFRDMFLRVCDEVCGKKRGGRSNGDAWWWWYGGGGVGNINRERCTEGNV